MKTEPNYLFRTLSRIKVQIDNALGIKPKIEQMTPQKRKEWIDYYNFKFNDIEYELELEIAHELFKYMSDQVLETTKLIQWYLVLFGGTWFLILQSYDLLTRTFPVHFIYVQIVSLFIASALGVYLRHKAWSYRLNTDVQRQLLLKISKTSPVSNEKLHELNEVVKGINIDKKELNFEEIAYRSMKRILPGKYVKKLQEKNARKDKKDFREEMFRHSRHIQTLIRVSISFYFLSIASIAVAGVLGMIGCI